MMQGRLNGRRGSRRPGLPLHRPSPMWSFITCRFREFELTENAIPSVVEVEDRHVKHK
jgi:hypothetical protein